MVGFQAQNVRRLAAKHCMMQLQVAAPIDGVFEGSGQTHGFNAGQMYLTPALDHCVCCFCFLGNIMTGLKCAEFTYVITTISIRHDMT